MVRCEFNQVSPGRWACTACGKSYRGERAAISRCGAMATPPAMPPAMPLAAPPLVGSGMPAQHPWQEWREEGGRWVARGFLPPGHAADPPQFDPLPGEVQFTPAFPVEEFAG